MSDENAIPPPINEVQVGFVDDVEGDLDSESEAGTLLTEVTNGTKRTRGSKSSKGSKKKKKQESPRTIWMYTYNNYNSPEKVEKVKKLLELLDCDNGVARYHLAGEEVGEQGTPHLQGMFQLLKKIRFGPLKKLLNDPNVSFRPVDNPEGCQTYCKKDGKIFVESGTLSCTTKVCRFSKLREHVKGEYAAKKHVDPASVREKFPQLCYGNQRFVDTIAVAVDLVIFSLMVNGCYFFNRNECICTYLLACLCGCLFAFVVVARWRNE